MSRIPLDRQILALTDTQLEEFVRAWAEKKKKYVEVKRFSGTGDLGRDVVGYLTKERHDGEWHNYQCKQYGRTLQTSLGILEVGKILYYAFRKEFTAPTAYVFVAPRGLHRDLKRYVSRPAEFKEALLSTWENNCATKISENQQITLSADLKAFIEQWDFSSIMSVGADEIINDPDSKPVLKEWFDVDPGPAPLGVVPTDITDEELPYIEALLHAYGEREGAAFDHTLARGHS